MKILTFWAEATVKPPVVLLALIVILMIWASDVLANPTYSNCEGCHGEFRADPYLGPPGGTGWTGSLHDIHETDMLGGDCSTCHAADFSVSLGSSAGGTGLAPIGCVGCHGRDEDMGNDFGSPGRGAGLRQHHTEAGAANCGGCHGDENPATYTPVFESVLPNYYANPGTGHSIPTSSCNGEDFAGSALGLDNDGNGIYDTADPNCPIPVELMIFEIE